MTKELESTKASLLSESKVLTNAKENRSFIKGQNSFGNRSVSIPGLQQQIEALNLEVAGSKSALADETDAAQLGGIPEAVQSK